MSKVYHVANPDVPGTIFPMPGTYPTTGPRYILVRFDDLVEFSGNPERGKKFVWFCNSNLLFNSPEEARAAHNPNHNPHEVVLERPRSHTLNHVYF